MEPITFAAIGAAITYYSLKPDVRKKHFAAISEWWNKKSETEKPPITISTVFPNADSMKNTKSPFDGNPPRNPVYPIMPNTYGSIHASEPYVVTSLTSTGANVSQ